MAHDPAVADLESFLAERGEPLRTAVLLAVSKEAGEDLLQAALERLLQNGTATAVADGTAEVDTRDALIRLLTQLPPRQRAVIVARY